MDEDQRSAPRVEVGPDFSVLQTTNGEQFIGIIYNISHTGVLIDVSQSERRELTECGNVSLQFLATPDILWPVLRHVRGKVVRQDLQCWGVRFDEPLRLSQAELDRLQEYLEVPEGPEWSKH